MDGLHHDEAHDDVGDPARVQLEALPEEALPRHVEPMLAKLASDLPRDDAAHAYEVKWDGVRAIAFVDAGTVRLESRTGNELTAQYPELHGLAEALGGRSAVLDGEIVALGADGLPSFQRLQARFGLKQEHTIRARAAETPATLMLFDVLHLDGRSTRELPYTARRALLAALGLEGPHWRVPPHHVGDGAAWLAATTEQGLEGIVAKRLDSRYVLGARTTSWLKIKNHGRQEFVIGGWTEGSGARAGRIGALLLGYQDRLPDAAGGQQLVYAGSVGTGFTQDALDGLAAALAPLARATSPFDVNGPGDRAAIGKWQAIRAGGGAAIRFVEPTLVCEVEFTEFTRDGTLRHPSFKGLRDDKPATLVIRESPGR